MTTVELDKEELQSIVQMLEGSTIQMGQAEKALALLKKLKEALKCQEKED